MEEQEPQSSYQVEGLQHNCQVCVAVWGGVLETYKRLDHKLQVFINTCLRQILFIRWPERISDQATAHPQHHPDEKVEMDWAPLRREQTIILCHGLKPLGKEEKWTTSPDMQKAPQSELKTIGLSWGEAKWAAQDRHMVTYSEGPIL